MAARRSSRGRPAAAADENRAITPDQPGRDSPRSRKRLDLSLKGSVKASPLSELNRAGWRRAEGEEETTPAKKRQQEEGESTPAKRIRHRQEEVEEEESLHLSPSPASPELIPKTPTQIRPRFSANSQVVAPKSAECLVFPTPPRRKRGSLPAIPDQFRQALPSVRKAAAQQAAEGELSQQPVEKIAATAFYGRHSGSEGSSSDENDKEAKTGAEQPGPVRAEAELTVASGVGRAIEPTRRPTVKLSRRPAADKSIARRHSGGGGGKRKRAVGLGVAGVSHAIKRPKKRPRLEPVKISELPTISIEIPKPKPSVVASSVNPLPSSQAASSPAFGSATPSGRSTSRTPLSTPKTGNFRLSKETRVDVEVTGGQIIYRKKSKISGGTLTPLRRSPRKTMSPLKQSYLAGPAAGRHGRRSGGSQKLFSPQGPGDYLAPPAGGKGSPRKFIPSPVKFRVASEEEESEENDFSQLIDNLGADEEKEEGEKDAGATAYTVFATEEELAQTTAATAPDLAATAPVELIPQEAQFVNDADCAQAALQAVNDILSGMDTCEEVEMEEEEEEDPVQLTKSGSNDEENKLFPIFYYKSGGGAGVQTAGADSSSSSGGPVTARPHTGRRLAVSRDPSQMQIDAGQDRGPTLCLTCGAVYSKGDPVDEANHESLHNGVLERLRFPGWRSERVGGVYGEGRVVVVQPGDPPHMWRKVQEALTTVDRDLGFSEVGIRAPEQTKAFIYISQKRIVGLLLAEAIPQGYKMVASQDGSAEGKVPVCSDVALPVKCGISRIWVLPEFRRKRVASSLVDTMRVNFIIGEYLGEMDFAFSDPTINGYDFASSYLKRPDFLVYNR